MFIEKVMTPKNRGEDEQASLNLLDMLQGFLINNEQLNEYAKEI
jgi:hypothetical protein